MQPHSPPPMGGPCGTPHFVYDNITQQLRDLCKPAQIPTVLLPPSKDMKERDWEERLVADMMAGASALAGRAAEPGAPPAPFMSHVRALARQAQVYARLNDPHGMYAYCPYAVE